MSFEVIQDATNLVSEISRLLVDGMDQLTAVALTTGSGTNQPTGLVTALAAASGSVVTTTTGDTLTSGDIYRLLNALPPRFQPNAQFTANLAIISTLAQFETNSGALKFPGLQNSPRTLLGHPISELSTADGTIEAGQDNNVLIYGDYSQYVIADRWPNTIEMIPHLFGPNRLPTGQRGALLHCRIGADVLVPNAFRLLQA